ncbi:hypothetical protein FXO38_05597 [Capsicum annuum]|nr:hypothetical protein FXO38_05597 [Capsicum annuum]
MEENVESKDAPVDDIGLQPKTISDAPLVKELPSFIIVEREGHIIACAALFPLEKNKGRLMLLVFLLTIVAKDREMSYLKADQSGISTRDKGLSWKVSLNLVEERKGQIMKSNLTDLRSYSKILMVYFPAPVLLKDREQLEMQRRKAKAKLQAKENGAEEAQRRTEVEAAAEAKRRKERYREAARQALLQKEMKKVMDIDLT